MMVSRLLIEVVKEVTRKFTMSRFTVSEGITYWNMKCRMRLYFVSRSVVVGLFISMNMGVCSVGVDAMSVIISVFLFVIIVFDM